MLVRDSEGRLVIISRKDCKNESVYNEKLYNIRLNYTKKYKSVIINPKVPVLNKLNKENSKDFTDD
jgi:hypothetical protein